ncbi:histone-lysine N-methyltransferase SETMAR [Trichonephila clavipes]|nr:histone-lysine N-methyltransferase SETMAR [Trichonephila clavipes]
MLCVWWTCRKVVHYELLLTGQTVTADLYSQQMKHVQQALHQKEPSLVNRKGVLLLHDNAKPHVARVAYSLNIHLRGKSFTNEAVVRQALTDFFASHTPEFYLKGIEQLETRWQKVLDADGDYFARTDNK